MTDLYSNFLKCFLEYFSFVKFFALCKESVIRCACVAGLGQLLKPWSSQTSWGGEQPGC